ncbi:MAG: F0F1 ATP synthase subunit B [Paludibacteraceae bacterium]|jgi:F-type H+-transporting ATPase subunit b|nr:F0F1 ATP synthase subunit B [Paludibacteraceae bacterium]MDD5996647.1 F0F1 ATP synthase subunit B [Bacteroidales bacterium]MBP5524474.1 F0F1 ATP synthase subunit B [Paludibacteraceae bacterium]MBR6111133.1 F0F1 ATP synthase subunit B [Paludibacteraceae bacterium]MBS7362653.1 F0F1 ATP synthase subunit B [Paludibacteraceae bacterium]
MELLTPDFGLVFWMVICFTAVLFILGKYGWPVIVGMINKRSDEIEESILKANEANARLAGTNAETERLLAEAKNERLELLKEASKQKDQIIADAKAEAAKKAQDLLDKAKEDIQLERDNAIKEIRTQVAELSVSIAEKVVREKLTGDKAGLDMINKLLDEVNIAKS